MVNSSGAAFAIGDSATIKNATLDIRRNVEGVRVIGSPDWGLRVS
jgi:hypothetical protein